MSDAAVWIVLALVWVFAAAAGGALLALLVRRALPGLSFGRLWVYYAALLALGSAVFFAIGIR